jgi:hypothetical protein
VSDDNREPEKRPIPPIKPDPKLNVDIQKGDKLPKK